MAYTIRNDATGVIVYDPRLDDAILIDPELHQKDNAFGSFECEMFSNHSEYGNLHKRRTIYAIYKDDAPDPMWKGIFIEGSDGLSSSMSLYFEDFMSVLRDSMQDAFVFTGQPNEFLASLIDAHNAQVDPWQRVTLGHVTVVDPNDYVRRSSESELSTWDVIKTRLIDTLGGHVRMRYEGGVAYLDYLEGDTANTDPHLNTSTQIIEFGENLTDFSRVVSASETYTACIPKGAKVDQYDDEGELHSVALTIESVNNGSKYLIDEVARALYGFRCAPLDLTTWEDVTVAANLMSKGDAWLHSQGVKLANTIKLSAVDLKRLGITSDSFAFLDYVRVSIYPLDIEALYLLTEITIPLDDPSELSISLGETFMSLADRQQQNASQLQQSIEKVEQSIPGKVQTGVQNEIAETLTTVQTLIEQTGNSILSQVSEIYTSTSSFEEFQSQVSTMIEQTANSFEMQFSTITSQITSLDGSVSSRFSEISKYIRFVDGNIILGVDGDPLILKITNERLQFLHNNVEIAYFSSGRLYVDKLHAITSLTLGDFAFSPDSSRGMNLKYIGM
ncbi:MAG: phage tail protein [Kiritimatiellae bacterium]|nr:phage tail protein [Kiritimatiellia bacterium]